MVDDMCIIRINHLAVRRQGNAHGSPAPQRHRGHREQQEIGCSLWLFLCALCASVVNPTPGPSKRKGHDLNHAPFAALRVTSHFERDYWPALPPSGMDSPSDAIRSFWNLS